jgi:hypothetical protein
MLKILEKGVQISDVVSLEIGTEFLGLFVLRLGVASWVGQNSDLAE